MYTYKQRQELKALSKKIFGTSSYWYNHIENKGVRKTRAEREADPTGASVKYLQSYDLLKAFMLQVEADREAMKAKMKAEADARVAAGLARDAERLAALEAE